MTDGYRILFLGENEPLSNKLWHRLIKNVRQLGIDNPTTWLHRWHKADYHNTRSTLTQWLPLVTVYLGNSHHADSDAVQEIVQWGLPVFPVVSTKEYLESELPDPCRNFQCTFTDETDWENRLANSVLETLALLRDQRRLFISYKRDDASGVAQQLFDALNGRGFHVFLDTAEIIPGKKFQTVLMHQLIDSDLLILLDSPNSGASKWVERELNQAEDHGIGILKLIWPNRKIQASASRTFLTRYDLSEQQFVNRMWDHKEGHLDPATLSAILSEVEKSRARSVGRRMENLLGFCRDSAKQAGLEAFYQPGGLLLKCNTISLAWLHLLPGIPVSRDFHALQSHAPIPNPLLKALYYKSEGVDPEWKTHVQWLEQRLSIRCLDQTTLDACLRGIP